jgi:biotin carboxylase
MRIHLVARNPTDSVTDGLLPAAARLGAEVTLVTDDPAAHLRAYATSPHPPAAVLGARVTDATELIGVISRLGRPDAVLTNSDHLQTQVALAADYLGLPGKPWAAALRTKNKALMRRQIAAAGLDKVFAVELGPTEELRDRPALRLPGPCVVKPREGVASEDVFLVGDLTELRARVHEIRARRGRVAVVIEEFLDGPLHTLETLGDGRDLRVLGGFATRLGTRPHFVEAGLDWRPDLPPEVTAQVLAQLAALEVGLGACHTEFVVVDGRARLIEVNYRLIGDQCDLLLAELLGEDLFGLVLRAHLGEPVASRPTAPPAYGHARVEYVYARRAGVLLRAPGACDLPGEKVLLRYRPLRPVGAEIALTRTNRDYLGVLRALGDDRPAVDVAVEDFLAAHTWQIGEPRP